MFLKLIVKPPVPHLHPSWVQRSKSSPKGVLRDNNVMA
jgi:hypothetical protein